MSSPAPDESPSPAWVEVWADDFGGDALDGARWSPEVSCWGGGNSERQCYTDRTRNISVADGALIIKALPERFTGPLYADDPDGKRVSRDYTSGKITTRGKASWKYGRFSARMKLPAGQGAWPAFWMMPASDVYGAWPLSGEIDIMEAVNLGVSCEACEGGVERRTSGALHFGGLWPENTYRYAFAEPRDGADPAAEWKVYTVEWAEGVIQWFVDGKIFMRIEADTWEAASPAAAARPFAPFDQEFFLKINLAVGGHLPEKQNGRGFDPSTFPAELQVDWVRVERCEGDAETGKACLSRQEWGGTLNGPWETRPS